MDIYIYIYRHMRDIQGNHMLERPAVASERGLVMSTLGLRVHYTLNIIRNPPQNSIGNSEGPYKLRGAVKSGAERAYNYSGRLLDGAFRALPTKSH